MKKLLKCAVLALALGLGSSTYAHAETVTVAGVGLGGLIGDILGFLFPPPPNNNNNYKNTAPEVDPSLAMSGFMLLGGTLTVLRSRRSERTAKN
jgi:hypothetical protein